MNLIERMKAFSARVEGLKPGMGGPVRCEITVTEPKNVGPDGWWHVMVNLEAPSAASALALAREALEIAAGGKEAFIRVPPSSFVFHGFCRFSMRERPGAWTTMADGGTIGDMLPHRGLTSAPKPA